MKNDTSNGNIVAIYFLEMFHRGVKQANGVIFSRLQVLKLMAYVRIAFRFNSDQY